MFGTKSKTNYANGQVLDADGFRLRLRVNARARRISLRLDNKTGEAVVTAPRPRDLSQAVEFALTRRDWILGHLEKRTVAGMFQPGMDIPYLGSQLRLTHSGDRAAARLIGGVLSAGGEGEAYHRRIERFLRKAAKDFAEAHTELYAQQLGATGVTVSLFDAKGRWGSCTPGRKAIRYSWRLIMADETVFSYVCAHEVAHLKHPDHSDRFWAEVERLFGDYRPARQWLKTHGTALFGYGA
ncbi:SprT family zinc-dependent metalloprotease [Asticcacaulis sp. BYS171W]|uniref:SprT family zinc-dependent metalloprotease n=1 Tax=Asticcacaulis aquaticus TaxID=2984212 RepID=A0ABT5HRA9_9CAUL|nr:SprT family zinc-dependent metalloprotease [Asticcacaulis aquaticus]